MSVFCDPTKEDKNVNIFHTALAASCVLSLITTFTAFLGVPQVHLVLQTAHTGFDPSVRRFVAQPTARVLPDIGVFWFSIAVSGASCVVDGTMYWQRVGPNSPQRRYADATVGGITAFAAYVTLGGIYLPTALFATLVTFHVYMLSQFDGVALGLGLTATLLDGVSASSANPLPRLLLAVTYAVFTTVAVSFRRFCVKPDVAVVIGLTGRMSFVWQAFAILKQLDRNQEVQAPESLMFPFMLPFIAIVYIFAAHQHSADAGEEKAGSQIVAGRVNSNQKARMNGCVVTFRV
jgi:hypothetical protein